MDQILSPRDSKVAHCVRSKVDYEVDNFDEVDDDNIQLWWLLPLSLNVVGSFLHNKQT